MKLIAIVGVAGAGKSTVAEHLVHRHGFVRTRFAQPLKEMLRALLMSRGGDYDYINRCTDGDLKETPIPELNGRTPRHAMQTLGTEWGRGLVHDAIWVDAWEDMARAESDPVVVDDCRFVNEAAKVKALGGQVWRVERPGFVAGPHRSEQEQLSFGVDHTFINDAGLDQLYRNVDARLLTAPSR